jgi:hypothetical protein
MKKLGLLGLSVVVAGCAASAADTLDLRRSNDPTPVQKRFIQERPIVSPNAANSGFGAAIEQLVSQRAGSVTDPSGKYSVQVMPDGLGQVIRLVSVNAPGQVREWKLGSGAGDRVVSATISELMTATGLEVGTQLSSAMVAQPLVGTLKD